MVLGGCVQEKERGALGDKLKVLQPQVDEEMGIEPTIVVA